MTSSMTSRLTLMSSMSVSSFGEFPFSLQIAFPEADLSRHQEAPRETVVLDDELGLRARRAAIEMHLAPVREGRVSEPARRRVVGARTLRTR